MTTTPRITLTESARAALDAALKDAGEQVIRIDISPALEHDLSLGDSAGVAITAVVDGITFTFDAASAARADGLAIDYVNTPGGAGFKLVNPNEPVRVQPMSTLQLSRWIESKESFELIDVRTTGERAIARIEGSRLLDRDEEARLLALPRDTKLVFQCHHGVRSRAAAEHFLAAGFTRVFNLDGGIDAWSREIDPSVPTY